MSASKAASSPRLQARSNRVTSCDEAVAIPLPDALGEKAHRG
jgi:hypothetical protein